MASYKVKLDDGSEIDIDLDTVRTWYREGLIGPQTPVLKAGTTRWVKLEQVINVQKLGSTTASRKRAQKEEGFEEAGASGPGEPQPWRTVATSVVLFLLAIAAGLAYFFPQRLPADLDGAPWRELALGLALTALLLVRGWELGRKLGRLLLFLASFALLATGGALLARGAGREGWLVLGSAWLVVSSLFAFLSRNWMSWLKSAAWLLLVVAGLAGLVRFGYVPVTATETLARDWAESDGRFVTASGWVVTAPPDWVRLRDGNPLVNAPDAAVSFAAPRLGAFAVVWEDTPAPAELDRQLDRLVERRRGAIPGFELVDRGDSRVAGQAAREGEGRWQREGVELAERDLVWQDAWVGLSLATWAPSGGPAQRALGVFSPEPGPQGTLADRVRAAAEALSQQQPLLSSAAARQVLSEARTLELPGQEVVARSLAAAARGRGALAQSDARELERLEGVMLRVVGRSGREPLRALLEGRGGASAVPLAAQAAASLAPDERLRLREIYARAAEAGLTPRAGG